MTTTTTRAKIPPPVDYAAVVRKLAEFTEAAVARKLVEFTEVFARLEAIFLAGAEAKTIVRDGNGKITKIVTEYIVTTGER